MKESKISAAVKNRIGAKKWKGIKYFCIAIPFLVFYFMFSYVPLAGWLYAFFEYKPGRAFYDVEWAGLKFFKKIFTDRELTRVLRNTFVMTLSGLALSPMPVALAILVNDVRSSKVRKFIQTTTTFPNFISWVIVFGLAQGLFSANGMLNDALKILHLPYLEYGLIGDKNAVWGFQIALGAWKNYGWDCIIYLAAITGIDTELYDAAKVDGANKVQRIRHITIPGVLPTYLVLLLLGCSSILSAGFEQYYVFWNNLVADKIEVLDYYIYKVGMKNMQYSYSIAAGMVKSVIGIVLLLLVNAIAKRTRGTSLI